MAQFLSLKHWQIFLLSWGPLSIILITLFAAPDLFLNYFPFALALALIGLLNCFAWIWSIIRSLRGFVKSMNTKPVMIAFWITFTYVWSIVLFMLVNLFVVKIKSVNPEIEMIIIVIAGIVSILSVLYGLFFVGKLVKAAELGKVPPVSDHRLESILMLFAPIGVWMIQPRLNKLVANSRELIS